MMETLNIGGFPTSVFFWTLIILTAIVVGYMMGASRNRGYYGTKGGKAEKDITKDEDDELESDLIDNRF